MEQSYTKVMDSPRAMKGKGAPQPTVFGVLGKTKMDSETKSLGGLVRQTTGGKSGKGTVVSERAAEKSMGNTEHHILGTKGKTALPGSHYGQVPYAGAYYKAVGAAL